MNWRGKHRVRLEGRTALRTALCLELPLEKRPGLHGASGHRSGSFSVTNCTLLAPSSFPSPGPSEPLVFRCLGFWPQSPSGAPPRCHLSSILIEPVLPARPTCLTTLRLPVLGPAPRLAALPVPPLVGTPHPCPGLTPTLHHGPSSCPFHGRLPHWLP